MAKVITKKTIIVPITIFMGVLTPIDVVGCAGYFS
jgi:hypothetical protein